jgi:hypothetical protein
MPTCIFLIATAISNYLFLGFPGPFSPVRPV